MLDYFSINPFSFLIVQFYINLSNSTSGYYQFTQSITNDGQDSIRNIFISALKCYPSCKECTGPKFNQCTNCYYGLPKNNICPPCSSNQYYKKNYGYRDICYIEAPLCSNEFCQSYPIYKFDSNNSHKIQWFLIYDPLHDLQSYNLLWL